MQGERELTVEQRYGYGDYELANTSQVDKKKLQQYRIKPDSLVRMFTLWTISLAHPMKAVKVGFWVPIIV